MTIDVIPIYIATAVAVVVTVVAVAFRLLTLPAAITAAVMLVASAVFWGYTGFAVYAIPFLLNGALGAIGKKKRKEREQKLHEHSGRRGLKQVLVNGGPALIIMCIAFFTRLDALYAAAVAALAEAFADSEAGDFGMAFGGKTVNILTFKSAEKGLSGGVSAEGSVASVIAAAIVAAIPVAFNAYDGAVVGAVAAGAVLGVITDSVLGASVQALYRCPECKTLTEKKFCCRRTQLIRGSERLNNDAVNIISSLAGAVLGGGFAALALYL